MVRNDMRSLAGVTRSERCHVLGEKTKEEEVMEQDRVSWLEMR